MRKFDLVLFDAGSTLIYYDGDWSQVFQQSGHELLAALRAAGYGLDDAFRVEFARQLKAYVTERETEFIELTTAYLLKNLLAEYGHPDAPVADITRALQAMYAVSQAHWKLEEDALPVLAWLKDHSYRLGLVSNAGDAEDVRTLLSSNGLTPFFEHVFISAEVGYRKPHPQIFRRALEAFNVSPQRSLMVGDTLGADILGAKNAGLTAAWISRRAARSDNRSHEDTILPDIEIKTLAELIPYLESL